MRSSYARAITLAATLVVIGGITHAQAPQHRIVVQNYYYALPGKSQEVYELRLHASEVRVSLGLPRGRVLRRVADPRAKPSSPQLPDVIWECEYPYQSARDSDVATLGRSEKFARIEKRMDSLLDHFQRAAYTIGGE